MTRPQPPELDYDHAAVTLMLAALIGCHPAKRLDSLAVVTKAYVEGYLEPRPAQPPTPRREAL